MAKKEKIEIVTPESLARVSTMADFVRARLQNSKNFADVFLECVCAAQQKAPFLTIPALEENLHITRDQLWKYLEWMTKAGMLTKRVDSGTNRYFFIEDKLLVNTLIRTAKKIKGVD